VTRYVLDTDHLSLLQRGHPALKSHIERTPPDEIAITIITVEEQMRGRLAQIKKAATGPVRIQAYRWLRETIDFFKDLTILDFDTGADAVDESLRQQKLSLGTQDRRIAAIALAQGCVLVTRNQTDFGKVPGLMLQDWTK
jgi:tRNA(fMet)-specific endonuclease VapC